MCLSIIVISLGLICLCSRYVHLYICKKKKKKKKKKKLKEKIEKKKKRKKKSTCVYVHSILHHWTYILISDGHFIEHVCRWEFICELSKINFYFFCIHFITSFVRGWDEWHSSRGSRSLSFSSLHSLLMWLHSMFDLSWSSFLFICSSFRHHPRHCFWFILFTSPSYLYLTVIYSKFATLFASFLHISLSLRSVSFVFSSILYSY